MVREEYLKQIMKMINQIRDVKILRQIYLILAVTLRDQSS